MCMKNILTAAVIAALFVSCSKSVSELPPETQTGANTFGSKVNGEIWVPQGLGAVPTNDILEGHLAITELTLNARNFSKSPTETEFEIHLVGVTGPGTYLLNADVVHPSSDQNYAYYVKRKFTPENEWLTSAHYTGVVNITKLDIPNMIVSGNFHFDMMNIYNAPEPVSVTEGRFDIKLK